MLANLLLMLDVSRSAVPVTPDIPANKKEFFFKFVFLQLKKNFKGGKGPSQKIFTLSLNILSGLFVIRLLYSWNEPAYLCCCEICYF